MLASESLPSSARKNSGPIRRFPPGFWATFNAWWHEQYALLGQRPSSKAISSWHQENAEKVWGSEAVNYAETQRHANRMKNRRVPLGGRTQTREAWQADEDAEDWAAGEKEEEDEKVQTNADEHRNPQQPDHRHQPPADGFATERHAQRNDDDFSSPFEIDHPIHNTATAAAADAAVSSPAGPGDASDSPGQAAAGGFGAHSDPPGRVGGSAAAAAGGLLAGLKADSDLPAPAAAAAPHAPWHHPAWPSVHPPAAAGAFRTVKGEPLEAAPGPEGCRTAPPWMQPDPLVHAPGGGAVSYGVQRHGGLAAYSQGQRLSRTASLLATASSTNEQENAHRQPRGGGGGSREPVAPPARGLPLKRPYADTLPAPAREPPLDRGCVQAGPEPAQQNPAQVQAHPQRHHNPFADMAAAVGAAAGLPAKTTLPAARAAAALLRDAGMAAAAGMADCARGLRAPPTNLWVDPAWAAPAWLAPVSYELDETLASLGMSHQALWRQPPPLPPLPPPRALSSSRPLALPPPAAGRRCLDALLRRRLDLPPPPCSSIAGAIVPPPLRVHANAVGSCDVQQQLEVPMTAAAMQRTPAGPVVRQPAPPGQGQHASHPHVSGMPYMHATAVQTHQGPHAQHAHQHQQRVNVYGASDCTALVASGENVQPYGPGGYDGDDGGVGMEMAWSRGECGGGGAGAGHGLMGLDMLPLEALL